MTEVPLINKVAQSGLIVLDLDDFYPRQPPLGWDMKDHLFRGLILKEVDFRAAMKAYPWEDLRGQTVAVYCSTDAIIPNWAYMLVGSYLSGVQAAYSFGTPEAVAQKIVLERLSQLDPEQYRDERVVIKGCGEHAITPEAYLMITQRLMPVVKSLMFGEPCSTVPVFKRK